MNEMSGVADQSQTSADEAARNAETEREAPRRRGRLDLPEPAPEPIFELAPEIAGFQSDQRLRVGARFIPDDA